MKRFLEKQFLNIVFVVLIVAAALLIYFLSRSEQRADASVSPSAAADVTPEPKAVFSGVPEEVLLTHLITAEAFSAVPAEDGNRVWVLTVGESPSVKARFTYEVELGAVTGFTLSLPLPTEKNAKSSSSIDQKLSSAQDQLQAAWSQAVITMLSDLIPTCDADDAIPEATAYLWAVKASLLNNETETYSDKAGGGLFLAYVIASSGGPSLVCTLSAPS